MQTKMMKNVMDDNTNGANYGGLNPFKIESSYALVIKPLQSISTTTIAFYCIESRVILLDILDFAFEARHS
jgi:hypothetical protein